MPQSGIYVIVNNITSGCYVGSSARLSHRREQHFNALRRGDHPCLHLQRSYDKHGEDAFDFQVIEEVLPEKDLLLVREQYWIDTLKPQFNARLIATSNLGMRHSEETRKKQSEAAKKRPPQSREAIERAAAKRRGRRHTDEERQKRSESLKIAWQEVRVLTEEDRERLSTRSRLMWENLSEEERKARLETFSASHMGVRRSEESRNKQSETLKARGYRHSEERRKLQSERRKEAWERSGVTDEDRERLSNQAKTAWEHKSPEEQEATRQHLRDIRPEVTEEVRRKQSETMKAIWAARKAAKSQDIDQPKLFE